MWTKGGLLFILLQVSETNLWAKIVGFDLLDFQHTLLD